MTRRDETPNERAARLLAARKKRAGSYPEPKWGDHVLRGWRGRTTASVTRGWAPR